MKTDPRLARGLEKIPAIPDCRCSIRRDLPDGFKAGDIHWPVPERLEEAGLTTYGYPMGVFLISEITPPASLAGDAVTFKAQVDWLACERICVPGKADLLLNTRR